MWQLGVLICFSLPVTFINFFSVWKSLWVFCNAKIARLQASKSSRNCSSSMQLGNVFILLICTVWFDPTDLRPIVSLGALGSTLTEGWCFPNSLFGFLVVSWPYRHACPGDVFIFTERLSGAKDTCWLGCNRHLPSVIQLPLFSFCSGVIWDIVILRLKQGRGKTSSSDHLDIRKSCGRLQGFKVWVLLSRS